MAKTHTGLIYPKARGKELQVLNLVIEDLIEAIVQCWFCDAKERFPKDERAQHGYVWKKVHYYSGKVIAHQKY